MKPPKNRAVRTIALRALNAIESNTGFKVSNDLGLRITYNRIKRDTNLYFEQYGEESVTNRRFYNICAGGHGGFGGYFYHPFWTNIDVEAPILLDGWKRFDSHRDIKHDLLNKTPLPIDSNTAEIIQSQYTIEHMDNDTATYFMKDVYRALKPGGVFKVVTPNIELGYRAYLNGDKTYYKWVDIQSNQRHLPVYGYKTPLNKASFEQVAMVFFAAHASTIHSIDNPNKISDEEYKHIMHSLKMEDALDYCTSRCSIETQRKFRSNHMNWWNHEKLINSLKAAGFTKIQIMAPGQSTSPVMRNPKYFDNLGSSVALFIEAIK
nr:hypothetical protein [uncultured Carboxylicivirga sp.]